MYMLLRFIFISVCAEEYHVCAGTRGGHKGVGSFATGVSVSCEPPIVGSGN